MPKLKKALMYGLTIVMWLWMLQTITIPGPFVTIRILLMAIIILGSLAIIEIINIRILLQRREKRERAPKPDTPNTKWTGSSPVYPVAQVTERPE